jgi:hypothetical protein
VSSIDLAEHEQLAHRHVTAIRRNLEHAVEGADLARRNVTASSAAAPVWYLDEYRDGEFRALRYVLAELDGHESYFHGEQDRLRRTEEAATLTRRVVVALHNEADQLHLSRFYAVTRRARHACTRAYLRLPIPVAIAGARIVQEAAS